MCLSLSGKEVLPTLRVAADSGTAAVNRRQDVSTARCFVSINLRFQSPPLRRRTVAPTQVHAVLISPAANLGNSVIDSVAYVLIWMIIHERHSRRRISIAQIIAAALATPVWGSSLSPTTADRPARFPAPGHRRRTHASNAVDSSFSVVFIQNGYDCRARGRIQSTCHGDV